METGLKVGVEESPESSWSENTTPGCDDIEEVVRQQQYRTHLPTKGSRFMRPAIRRRLNIAEKVDRGHNITKAFTVTTIDTARSMDGSDASSNSTFTLVTSAPSSCADPWSPPGFVEEEADMLENMIGDDNDDEILVPKLEPIDDDDVDMMDVKESSIAPEMSSTSTSPVTTKRPRGRPRKHPKANPDSVMKLSKGRSKTGCITCRKRKKKCDEAKPGCMNCEKNSVKCEGYPQKTIWKSGKEKAEEARMRRNSVMLKIKLQPVIPGVETASDKMFFEHYIFRLSGILTVETDRNHSFKDMLLQYAVKHVGLMHSILALSSKHIDFRSPYGVKFLREHPDTDIKTLEARSQFHHERAMSELNKFIERQNNEDAADESNVAIPAIYGQMICLVLETLADPNPTGQHRIHLQAYSSLIKQYPPADRDFLRFIQEFFQYHISADELICLPEGRARLGTVSDDWNLPHAFVHPESVRLLGVSDGLFLYMSKITNIRNKIRENIRNDINPVVDYTSLYRAAEIDAGIREWTPSWPAGDSRDLAGLLYKQMMWIYLWRTIYPPRTTSWNPDPKIVQAVDDGIELLSQFKPSDPSQTLILAPAFVIGCAAFEDRQREPIRKAISVVKEYMQYKNSDSVLKVLEEVWRLMDAESEESWDWQMVAHRIGIDFLAT